MFYEFYGAIIKVLEFAAILSVSHIIQRMFQIEGNGYQQRPQTCREITDIIPFTRHFKAL